MSTDQNVPPPPPPGYAPPQDYAYGTPPPGPPKKKSWFARHKILTGILGLIVLFALINALGGGDDTGEASPSPTSPSESARASDAEGTGSSASSQGSTADEPAAEETAGVGEPVSVGDFEITVTHVEDSVTYVGTDGFGEEPQGQYVMVSLTVANTGSSAETFWDSEQKLIDDQGREHSTSSDAFYLEQGAAWLEEINPGNTFEGALLFDIPDDAVPTTLRLSSGLFGRTAEVSLAQ